MYFVYIINCADNTLYTGIATNVERRIAEHNSSNRGAKYTRSRRPVELKYFKKYRTRSTAQKAEAKIKQLSRAEKLALIESKV